jgi:hypothetical protein
MGSWGIYNSKAAATPKVNIDTDSAEIIKEKWSKADTKTGFTRNQYLYDLLKVMADEHTGADNLRKWFHNFEFDEVTIRTDTDAKAEVVSSKETYSSWEDIGTAGTITDWAEDPPSPKSMPEKSGKADRKTLRIAVIVAGTLMACFIGYVIAVPFGKHIGKRRKEKQRNEH